MDATPSHSEVLRGRMDITCGGLHSTFRRFWSDPDVGRRLPAFFILLHQIVRATLPLLHRCHAVAGERAAADALCRELLPYLSRHAEEERHHDEWLLQDLESAGIPRAEVAALVPSPAVASLVGAQYYWIQHHHPVALLGYMRILEGNPPSSSHIDRLEQVSGLPAAAFRTYRLHGRLDPHHREEMDGFLDSLPLSRTEGELVWVSAAHTARALAQCIDQISRRRPASIPR
jgi:pyrroloquinoline quinone (PQQ) biosynthesis protein C